MLSPVEQAAPMGSVIGQLLPLAVAVAISPVPIIATILMLLAPRAQATSVVVVITATAGLDDDSDSASTASSWIKIVLGPLLLLLTAKQWRGRPKPGEEATLPTWMSAIDSFTFVKALALGFVLSAVNPKNLLMCIGAGTAIGGGDVNTGEMVIAVAIFTVIGVVLIGKGIGSL
jgi:threonine/homoserine/homoserine lactone efflux protein